MAYVNVADWQTDQVCEWLKGLDNSVLPYVHSFTNNKVNGQQLLSLRPEDLEQLGVIKLGHQEIILEAVEYLRNFHYELDRENLQLLALRLSCQSHSLYNELTKQTDSKPVTTQTLSDVVCVINSVKPLIRWLDRSPFSGQLEYNDKKIQLLKLSIEMSTCAQRDRFAEKPIEEIRKTCEELGKLADYIIQDISDPMILQPSSLDLATLKKRPGDDLGFYILPSFHGTHQIAEIKFGSVAHQCGKMEEGDEIVQVNYQTVVGWERKNVLELFNESPAEVLLTLKRRPRHTKVYGQIYIKPYRLPSNKKTPYATRWQHNLPSPRPELLTIPDFTMPLPRHTPKDPSPEPIRIMDTVDMLDTIATDSSDSDSEVEPPLSVRLYASKPRSSVQRRATITGASPTTKHDVVDIEQFWKELKHEHKTTFHLRDKAASCAHGLDNVQSSNLRPQKCLGIEQTTKRKKKHDDNTTATTNDEKKVQFNEKITQVLNDNNNKKKNDKAIGINEINKIENSENIINNNNNNNNSFDNNTVPLNKNDDNGGNSNNNNNNNNNLNDYDCTPSQRCRKERGKLDKSHSTPAYDLTDTIPVEILDYSNNTKINSSTSNDNCSSSINDIAKTEINLIINSSEDNNHKIEGNVAQKINFIEGKFRENNVCNSLKKIMINQEKLYDDDEDEDDNEELSKKNSNKIDDDDDDDDDDDEIINEQCNDDSSFVDTNSTKDDGSILNEQSEMDKLSDICGLSRESSEEKSESMSSYMEGIYSSSSEADAPLVKFEHNSSLVLTEKNKTPDTTTPPPVSLNTPNKLTTELITNENQSLIKAEQEKNIEESKKVSSPIEQKKMDNKKSCSTPPEPPPRKYFNKPSPLNLNIINNTPPDPPERPRVPDRIELKKEIRKPIDYYPEHRTNSETIITQNNRDCFDGYRDFVEKSTDFIDEPRTPIERHTLSSSIDHFGYSEINERQLRDDGRSEKYESFSEKFGCGNSTIVQTQPEIMQRTNDSPDGAGCSRQTQQQIPELKSRTLEKDKNTDRGVVNRAMMVARNFGLHGGSKTTTTATTSSSESPKSNKKRNMMLAKRRNVSVKDVGQGELEGWLTYRSRGAGGAWARSWFILKGSLLYRFKNHDAQKADCLIALPGFTASQANEVKSRKYSFKVYHTGTVFYFAADTDDSLIIWLDFINKATLGADSHNRTSGLFSETDESDGENNNNKIKGKSTTNDIKTTSEKAFNSLKKFGKKDTSIKEHDISGASLDRKYLKFLGTRTQNVPVPTAQFRSYRRVLPSSTPNRKQECTSNSPDLRVTVAGSTFYGLTSSHSATDVPTTSQDMGDYRQTTDRSQSSRSRRPDDLRGFVTLEEFMLSHQSEDGQQAISNRSASPRQQQQRTTPLTNDHVHMQYRQYENNNNGIIYGHSRGFSSDYANNGMIYGHPRNGEESSPINNRQASNSSSYGFPRTPSERSTPEHHRFESIYGYRSDDRSDTSNDGRSTYERPTPSPRKPWESTSTYTRRIQEGAVYYPPKQNESTQWQCPPSNSSTSSSSYGKYEARNRLAELSQSRDPHGLAAKIYSRVDNYSDCRIKDDLSQSVPRRFIRDNGYSGSSGDLTCCTKSDTLQRARKEASVSRKGSFNLSDRKKNSITPDKQNWIDSLKRSSDKKSLQKSRLKTVAQYQPPPMPSTSPFEQDGMRATFEMHLDKGDNLQSKTSRLKSLFGSKSPQKLNTLDYPKETQKTLLGSPRLHRALFRDKSSSQKQHTICGRSGSQSPGDSGISQSLSSYSGISQSHTLSHSFSSVSSVSDWSPDGTSFNSAKCGMGHSTCGKRPSNASARSLMNPPTLPYIPPPTSPPPPDDYPGLEYPPVFEPGTYCLSDASLLRTKNIKKTDQSPDDDDYGNEE